MVEYDRASYNADGLFHYGFGNRCLKIYDNDFIEATELPSDCHSIYVIWKVYGDKGLDVVANWKAYYTNIPRKRRMAALKVDADKMAVLHYPILGQEFERHYLCMKRHIEKLNWIGK